MLVATPSSDIDDAVRVVRLSLIVGFTVLLAVLAAVAWRLIGATLRPVEALRVGAQRITGSNSTETLPLPNSADEIRRLAETLNDMLGRLEASRARQRAFVADAAHELRSPLASLRTQLDVAIATGDDADNADLLAEVDRLTRLVNDLLLLARVDDAAPPPRELLDLAQLSIAAADRYAAQPIPVSVERRGDTRRSGPIPARSHRMLVNVLDNAIRHARSTVGVRVRPRAAVAVRWSSYPMTDRASPPQERERVFERFARLHDARDRDSGGTGLGLAIVRELIGAQGGRVRLLDAVGGGLQVELRFPAASIWTGEPPRE